MPVKPELIAKLESYGAEFHECGQQANGLWYAESYFHKGRADWREQYATGKTPEEAMEALIASVAEIYGSNDSRQII